MAPTALRDAKPTMAALSVPAAAATASVAAVLVEGTLRSVAAATVGFIIISWVVDWDRKRRRAKGVAMAALAGESSTTVCKSEWRDPLRWACLGAGGGIYYANADRVAVIENDLCVTKVLAIHRPTHESWREKTGQYPFAWHMAGRRRLWEIRIQMRLRKVPQSKINFGITLGQYVPVSGVSRQVQKALVRACSVVGDIYHSVGDDPASTHGECETPTFAFPIWAFDQFVVSDPGEEPDLREDLEGVGMRRTDGLANYVAAFKDVQENLSPNKVYTFCFWGISQFLDVINWEICGLIPGARIDVSKLSGPPPIYVQMYQMPSLSDKDSDRRHLNSRKEYYFNVALWSESKPPSPETRKHLCDLAGVHESDNEITPNKGKIRSSALDAFMCCVGRGGATDAWMGA